MGASTDGEHHFRRIDPTELRAAARPDVDHAASAPLRPVPSVPLNEPSAMNDAVPVPIPPVKKQGTAESWKTTVAGIIAAFGLVGEELGRNGWPEDVIGWLTLLMKAFGPVLLGFFARDKNVTSEGAKIVTPDAKGR